MRLRLTTALRAGFLILAAGTAGAQAQDRRPAGLPFTIAQAEDETGAPDQQGDAAALTVRIDRLEGTIRSLTGQVEQLQFQNRRLSDDLRKMQQDVDFRFQDLNRSGGAPVQARPPTPGKRSDADAGSNGLPQDASGIDPATPSGASGPPRSTRRAGDAFDPDSNPGAPGVPRPLGSTSASAPLNTRPAAASGVTLNNAPSAPLDLMKRPSAPVGTDASTENGVAAIVPPPTVPLDAARPTANPSAVASLAPGGTRDEFNGDADLYRQGQYDSAATGLKSFIDKYPRDRMVPDAVYMLGEAYTKLGRHREAAEQYLRLSTDYSKAPRAPDALLRLGMSLNAMGVREQACATYQEVTRRFPAASTDVRAAVDRELKRARC